MDIRNVRHRGLKSLLERDTTKGLHQEHVGKLRDILTFLLEIETIEEVFHLRRYRPHVLTGSRVGVYSLRVSANWRLTFKYDEASNELYDLDLEDYH